MESYTKSTTVETTVLLTLAGVPVTTVLPSAVNVSIKKSGQVSFQTLTTTVSNWINLGSGFYTLVFSTAETDTAGNFVYKATGVGFDNLVFNQFNIVDPALAGSTQSYFQDSPAERTVYLELAGVPASSVLPASVICKIKKAGSASFELYALNTNNWKSLGGGYYTVKFDQFATSNVGSFVFTLTGTGFDNFAYDDFVIMPRADVSVNNKCNVSGSVINLSGDAAKLIKVTARMIEFPARFNGSLLGGDELYTFLDSNGNFTLTLLRGATCIIEIPRTGIRSQIIVPDAPSAKLIDLLPPFSVDYSV